VWHVDTAEPLAVLTGHADAVTALAFSPDGWLLASSSNDCSLRLWSVADAKCVSDIKDAHKKAVSSCTFHPDEQFIYTAALDGTVRIWNVEGALE
jgi:WD40 repeat protein